MANFDLQAKPSDLRPMTDLEERMFTEITSLRSRLAEAEALLREIREDALHFGMPTTRIDAFLAPDSAAHRENERA